MVFNVGNTCSSEGPSPPSSAVPTVEGDQVSPHPVISDSLNQSDTLPCLGNRLSRIFTHCLPLSLFPQIFPAVTAYSNFVSFQIVAKNDDCLSGDFFYQFSLCLSLFQNVFDYSCWLLGEFLIFFPKTTFLRT